MIPWAYILPFLVFTLALLYQNNFTCYLLIPILLWYHTTSIQNGDTAFMLAASSGKLEIVKYLKELGVHMEHENKVSRSIIYYLKVLVPQYTFCFHVKLGRLSNIFGQFCCIRCRFVWYYRIISYKFRKFLTFFGMERYRFLQCLKVSQCLIACSTCYLLIPILLWYHTTSIQNGDTAILLAASSGQLEIVKYLKELGVDMEHENKVSRVSRINVWYSV